MSVPGFAVASRSPTRASPARAGPRRGGQRQHVALGGGGRAGDRDRVAGWVDELDRAGLGAHVAEAGGVRERGQPVDRRRTGAAAESERPAFRGGAGAGPLPAGGHAEPAGGQVEQPAQPGGGGRLQPPRVRLRAGVEPAVGHRLQVGRGEEPRGRTPAAGRPWCRRRPPTGRPAAGPARSGPAGSPGNARGSSSTSAWTATSPGRLAVTSPGVPVDRSARPGRERHHRPADRGPRRQRPDRAAAAAGRPAGRTRSPGWRCPGRPGRSRRSRCPGRPR